MTTYNDLSDAQRERLELLAEECAEVICAITKIQRHGYLSHNPDNPNVSAQRGGRMYPDNLSDLEEEIGHLQNAIAFMVASGDVVNLEIAMEQRKKRHTFARYLHCQDTAGLARFVSTED